MGLFGKTPPPDPREKARAISRSLRKEERVLDRQIQSIKREEEKVKRSLRDAAKKGDKSAAAILAKEIIHSRKAVSRIYASKAQIKSVDMNIKNQVAMVRVSGAFEKSTEVMKTMQSLVKVGEVRNSMMDLSKEMTKMGIMEEMMEDTFESLEGDEEDEAAQEEIDKVLHEITSGAIGKLPDAEPHDLPSTSVVAPEEEEDEEEEDEMVQRLAALRS